MKRLIILNPASRNGKALEVFKKLEKRLLERLGRVEVYQTAGPGDATQRTTQALSKKEFSQILVAGGDGTINEAVNGYFRNGQIISRKIPLGVIDLGTGGDFYRCIRQISGFYDVSIQKNKYRLTDCGRVFIGNEKSPHYFINVSSGGLAASVLESLKCSAFQFGPPAYFYHTIKNLFMHRALKTVIRYQDEQGKWQRKGADLINLFICNGRYNGGGMNWAPNAEIEDGLFDVVLIRHSSKLKLVLNTQKVYAGRISELPGVEEFRATSLFVESSEEIKIETDGEICEGEDANAVAGEKDDGSSAKSDNVVAKFEIMPGVFPLLL